MPHQLLDARQAGSCAPCAHKVLQILPTCQMLKVHVSLACSSQLSGLAIPVRICVFRLMCITYYSAYVRFTSEVSTVH
jgi:hypothetical protein